MKGYIVALVVSALLPRMEPDYSEVTIPSNIAPLNFSVPGADRVTAEFVSTGKLKVKGKEIRIPVRRWHRFLDKSSDTIQVNVSARINGEWVGYKPFNIYKAEPADPFIAYRLIEPGYEVWNQMGIFQRNITNFRQKVILANSSTGNNCMNCHSFCNKQPDKMVFHMRAANGGTYLVCDDTMEKLNTKTDETISALVYPQWHPDGKYLAFSVNVTNQVFHMSDPNRIEVFDSASDVVVYDTEKHEIFSCKFLKGRDYETYPTFSADGNKIYFCSADFIITPFFYDKVHYSLCSIDFNPETREFGECVDTLYNARKNGGSVSLPRVSPDGRHLMFTLQSYGNFGIWHKDSDLYMMDLESREISPCIEANSEDVDSYHSWSTNSRWVLFSSRRDDGLYTRLYMAHVDGDGNVSKAFLLPQRTSSYYKELLKSYNIPEFVAGEVKVNKRKIIRLAVKNPGTDLKFCE